MSSSLPTNDIEFRVWCVEKISTMASMLESLCGNGQPGRIGVLEKRINEAACFTGGCKLLQATHGDLEKLKDLTISQKQFDDVAKTVQKLRDEHNRHRGAVIMLALFVSAVISALFRIFR